MTAPRPRTIVYVDGFNLYYGALKGGRHKWLDLERYFKLLRMGDDLKCIHYFTSRVSPPPVASSSASPSAHDRQAAYLRALATLPLVNAIEGKFKNHETVCRIKTCHYSGPRTMSGTIEKRTDVNIALQMLDDAYQDKSDNLVLVSGDSDIVPAVNMVKARFPEKRIIVYVPARDWRRGAATELRGSADKNRTLPQELLEKAQFPPVVRDGRGGSIAKPAGW